MELNENQKKISDPGFDVIVCAGAGTGKTTVLATRFLRYINESNAENVYELAKRCCAITFTEKSANEMRERVFQYAFEKFHETEEQRWFEIYRSLEFAQISTIHSFCRSLIAQDPLGAEMEPNFDVESKEIPAEEYTEQFLSHLIENYPQMMDEIFWAIKKLGRGNIKTCLSEMFKKRQYLGDSISELARAEPYELRIKYQNFIDNKERDFAEIVRERLQDFIDSSEKNSASDELLAEIEKILLGCEPNGEFLEEIFDALKGRRIPKLRKLVEIREYLKKMKFIGLELTESELNEIARLSIEMAKLYVEFEKYIWLGYEKESTVDFNELLIRALNLIENITPEQVRKIFPMHLLVDEFQDTSPIQWKIIRKLADYSDSVMFVGDEKQSIYRFRGADVSVVKKGERYISRRDGGKSGVAFPMNENYRTSKRLLEIFNKIFNNCFPAKATFDFEAEFQELKPAENADDDGFLWLVNPDILDDEGNFTIEQTHIVGDIIKMSLDKGIPDGRRWNFGDFLVLATSIEKVFNIVAHLGELGIPAIPLVNSGFYSASEIIFLRSLVDFLADTRRNGALFSLLTHPIFDIGMDKIYEILGNETDISLWDRLKIFYEGYDKSKNYSDDEIKLMKSFEKLSDMLENLANKSIYSILEQFLSDEEILSKILDDTPDFRSANIHKFLMHIYELEASGRDVNEISENLRSEKDKNETGFATPSETVDVVRISTIHSAKGLEANIVIVCDRGSKGRDWSSNTKFYAEPEIPYMFVPKIPNNDSKFFALIRQIASLKNDAESKRLFYVAFTRARRHLFIVPTKNGGDFFSNTISALGGKFDKKGREILWSENIPDGVNVLNASEIWYPENGKIAERKAEYKPVIDYVDKEIISENLWISVTDAASFFTCPQYFKLKSNILTGEYSESERKEFPPNEFGSIVHKILSTLPGDEAEIVQMAERLCTDEKVKKSVLRTVEKFLNSDFFKSLKDDVDTEVPLYFSVNGIRFKGFIDAMTENMLWDYKTGRRNSFTELEYFYQLNIYRLAMAKYRNIEPEKIEAKIIWLSDSNLNVQHIEWDDKIFDKIEMLKSNFTDKEKFESLAAVRNYCDYCPMRRYCEILK